MFVTFVVEYKKGNFGLKDRREWRVYWEQQLFKHHGLKWEIPSLMLYLGGKPYNKKLVDMFIPWEIFRSLYDNKVVIAKSLP